MTTVTWTGSSVGLVNGYGVSSVKVSAERIEFRVGIVGEDGVVVADEKVTVEFMEQAKMPAQEVVPTTMVLEGFEVDGMLEEVEKIVGGICASAFYDIDCYNG
jgi:2-methylaconitate cis-trans-isomerase PrpF